MLGAARDQLGDGQRVLFCFHFPSLLHQRLKTQRLAALTQKQRSVVWRSEQHGGVCRLEQRW